MYVRAFPFSARWHRRRTPAAPLDVPHSSVGDSEGTSFCRCRSSSTSVLDHLAEFGRPRPHGTTLAGGLSFTFSHSSQAGQDTPHCIGLPTARQEPGFEQRGRQVTFQRGDRKSSPPFQSGLLQPTFSCPQEDRRLAPCHRPQCAQQISLPAEVHHGNSREHQSVSTGGRMDYIHRSHRCLSPCAFASTLQEISQVCNVSGGLPIPSSSLRLSHGPSGVYKSGQDLYFAPKRLSVAITPVSGRLAVQGLFTQAGGRETSTATSVGNRGRLLDQRQQISTDPHSTFCFCGLQVQPRNRPSLPISCTSSGSVSNLPDAGQEARSVPTPSDVSHRQDVFGVSSCTRLETAYQTLPMAPTPQLASWAISRPSDTLASRSAPVSTLVDSTSYVGSGCTSTPSATPDRGGIRLLRPCLGRSLHKSRSPRSLAPTRSSSPYKLQRAKSYLACFTTVSSTPKKQASPSVVRQPNGCSVPQQRGRHTLLGTMCPNVARVTVVFPPRHTSASSIPGRKTQCSSGFSVTQTQDPTRRVVPTAVGLRQVCHTGFSTVSRSVRHSMEYQTPTVCLSGSRPPSSTLRCNDLGVDRQASVCLSSFWTPASSPLEISSTTLQSSASSTMATSGSMVSAVGPSVIQNSVAPSLLRTSVATTAQRSVFSRAGPQTDGLVSASGTDSLSSGEEVERRVRAPQRASTRAMYYSKWNVFERWAQREGVSTGTPSVTDVAKFFLFLFKVKQLAPSTIEGYKTALHDRLSSSLPWSITHNSDLQRLIQSFHRDRPKALRRLPQWDLALVLEFLAGAPFEPLTLASDKFLTLKVVFLIALATAQRRNELHALTRQGVHHKEDWSSVTLLPSHDFLAKNQSARATSAAFRPIEIVSLSHSVGRDSPRSKLLCPIRALRIYLNRMDEKRGGRLKLFIAFKPGYTREIVPATISSWLKQVIRLAYTQLNPQKLAQLNIKAHQVRATATSWAVMGGASLDQIVEAAHWSSHNVFTRFYLQSAAWRSEDHFSLRPVVAAGTVVSSH